VRIAAVEALDIHALIRLAWLDVVLATRSSVHHSTKGCAVNSGRLSTRTAEGAALVDVSPYSFTTLEELAERVGFEPDSFLWIP
jgi:hypothetical protein